MSQSYAVVTFIGEKSGDEETESSEVPSSWLTPDLKKCWWPKTRNIAQFTSKSIPPDTKSSKWNLHNIIFEGFYENLKIARNKAEYMSSSSGDDEAGNVLNSKYSIKVIPKHMDRIPESDSDEEKTLTRIPGPPQLTLPNNDTKNACKTTKINSQIDTNACSIELDETRIEDKISRKGVFVTPEGELKPQKTACSQHTEMLKDNSFKSQLNDYRNGNLSPSLLTCYSNVNSSAITDEAQMKITHNRVNSLENINKTNQTQKPTIVQDITFRQSSPALPMPKVLSTVPPVSRNSGHDHNFGSISFPLEDDVLQDIMGSQYTEQLATLGRTLQEYSENTSNAFGQLKIALMNIDSRLTEIERAVNINTVARDHGPQFTDLAAAFPLPAEADVMEFEAGLKSDENRRRCVTMYLSQVGGNCANECIRRILSRVFSIPLARVSSWQGQLGNFKVSELQIIEIIKDAVRVSYTCTDKFYEDEAKEWFRQGTQKYKRAQLKAIAKEAG